MWVAPAGCRSNGGRHSTRETDTGVVYLQQAQGYGPTILTQGRITGHLHGSLAVRTVQVTRNVTRAFTEVTRNSILG